MTSKVNSKLPSIIDGNFYRRLSTIIMNLPVVSSTTKYRTVGTTQVP